MKCDCCDFKDDDFNDFVQQCPECEKCICVKCKAEGKVCYCKEEQEETEAEFCGMKVGESLIVIYGCKGTGRSKYHESLSMA